MYLDSTQVSTNGSIGTTPVVLWTPLIKGEYWSDTSIYNTWFMFPNCTSEPSEASQKMHPNPKI